MTNVSAEYEIRAPLAEEYGPIGGVITATFDDDGSVANLVPKLRRLWCDGRGFELVATKDGELLGHVGFTRGYLDAPDQLHHVLVLSPLAVRPDRQGKGVGSALVRAGLDEAARRPFGLVFLEGAPRLYPKLGFIPGIPEGFGKPSARIPDPAFQVYYLKPEAKQLTGALVYPEVFWECDCVGLRPVDQARDEE